MGIPADDCRQLTGMTLQRQSDKTVEVKTPSELAIMREAGHLLREFRQRLVEMVRPGISTLELDREFSKLAQENGVKAAFHGLYGFPGHICASINHEVVHGIPSAGRILLEGDIVSLDMGIILDGFYSDAAVTAAVGTVSDEKRRLLETTERSLQAGIELCHPGSRLGDIGSAIQVCVEKEGFSVVREYTGHGIGRALHEAPQIPNFGEPGRGPRLCEGWVLAIEPMVNAGSWRTETLADDWTVVTSDRRPSAHFEHTVAITAQGPEVLT